MITTFLITTLLLFLWFLTAMYWLRRRHELRTRAGLAYWLLFLAAIFGVPGDVFYNLTGASLIFFDFPRELTLSQRMARYREAPKYRGTWRMRWADCVCERLLNPYDPKGRHC